MPTAKIGARRLPRRGRLRCSRCSPAPTSCAWTWRTGGRCRCRGSLWLNTGVLVLSSVALHCALVAARQRRARHGCGSACSPAASPPWPSWPASSWPGASWPPAAISLAANPANTFFYLITGVHGLHVLGGLVALARAAPGAWARGRLGDGCGLSVELCAIYWHFLLFVWLGAVRAAHRLGGRLHRHLPPAADLRDRRMAEISTAIRAAPAAARRAGAASSPTGPPTSARSRTCPGGRP